MFAYRESSVGKLFQFREWLELLEATKALSGLIRDEVSEADLLRLALDGHLTLSVRFATSVPARMGRAIPGEQARRRELPNLDGDGVVLIIDGTTLTDGRVIEYEDTIKRLEEVWDLPLLGGERLRIEELYEKAKRRPAPEWINLEGTFVTDSQGQFARLVERADRPDPKGRLDGLPVDHHSRYYPAAELPDDAVIVVRTSALRDFAARLQGNEPAGAEKPVGSRERATLLTIIAALAKMARINVAKPSAAAAAIEAQTELLGARVAARTIEEHLKRIPDAAR